MSEKPIGQRFTHVYLDRGQPADDSQRARARIAAFYSQRIRQTDNSSEINDRVAYQIKAEMGISIPFSYGYQIEEVLKDCSLNDFLDLITIVYRSLKLEQQLQQAIGRSQWALRQFDEHWVTFVDRVFREENLGYTVDECGGIHYYVDTEFAYNKAAALRGLSANNYGAARAAFERAYTALDEVPPDTATAVRSMFEALEIVAKLLDNRIGRLGATEVERYLRPLCLSRFTENNTERDATGLFIKSVADWTNACHNYRHGQAVEEPSPPPLGLTVALMSTGAAYLRFLIEEGGGASGPEPPEPVP